MVVSWVRVSLVALTLLLPLLSGPGEDPPQTDECPSGYPSDFNADGRADMAVADPEASVAGQSRAGRVVVLYGDADGRIGEGERRLISQGSGTVGDDPEPGDRFGSALSIADLDCDGFSDLVVGSPYEDAGAVVDAGLTQIVWGSATGLGTTRASRDLTRAAFGAPVEAGDLFGYAVDTQEDWIDGATGAPNAYVLAVGAPGSRVNGRDAAGWVGVEAPVDGDNTSFSIDQDTADVAGRAEAGDRFGAAVAVGQFRGAAGTIDVAVGSPGEDLGTLRDAGSVTIVTDLYDPPSGAAYDQDTAGVPGRAEAGDRFGRTLADLRVGAVSHLAVAVPGEDVGAAGNAGVAQLFTSTGAPVSSLAAGPGLSQDYAGVGGKAESGDLFGDRLAFSPPTAGDRVTRLAVGVPGEDGAAVDSGVVQVFPVADPAADRTWTQDSAGVPGVVRAGDRFGSSLTAITGPTEKALVIGVPDDADHPGGMVNVISLQGGFAPRAWVPGKGGVAAGATAFGAALPTR